jgi:hypothetical protein
MSGDGSAGVRHSGAPCRVLAIAKLLVSVTNSAKRTLWSI